MLYELVLPPYCTAHLRPFFSIVHWQVFIFFRVAKWRSSGTHHVSIPKSTWPRRRGSIPGWGKRFFSLFHGVQTGSGAHPPSHTISIGTILSEVKRPGFEAHRSPPPSAEVKNGEAVPHLPHASWWRGAISSCQFFLRQVVLLFMSIILQYNYNSSDCQNRSAKLYICVITAPKRHKIGLDYIDSSWADH